MHLFVRGNRFFGSAAAILLALALGSTEAVASPKPFSIDSEDAPRSLLEFGRQSARQILFASEKVKGIVTNAVRGSYEPIDALHLLLKGTPLIVSESSDGVLVVEPRLKARNSSGVDPVSVNSDGTSTRLAQANSTSIQLQASSNGPQNTNSSSSSPVSSGSEDLKLEEILVTAERRQESLEKVPMSLTAFSQKTMDELHLTSFSDLATTVPGLTITTAGNNTQSQSDVAIRGIFSGGNAPTTGIYIDETPIAIRQNAAGFSGSPQPDIFDLDRIEVLRGPQGTLFGSGAMGGVIRYITPQPNLVDSSGYAKAEFGYTDRGAPSYAVGLAYGAPIIQGEVGFRLSGWFHSDGGFIDIEDPFNGQILKRNANWSDSYVFRPAFTFVPTEGLVITPAVFVQHHHTNEPDQYWLTELPNPDGGAAYVSGFGSKNREPATDDLTISSLAIKYDFHGMSLQSDTSYTNRRYNDFDDWTYYFPPFFGLPPVDPALASWSPRDENIQWTKAWQQEFRLASQDPEARLSWVVGAYYRHSLDGLSQLEQPDLTPLTEAVYGQTSLQIFGVPDYVLDGQAYTSYTWFTTVTEQKAAFGEIAFNLLSRLKANIGVRVEHSAVEDQRQIVAGPLEATAYSATVLPNEVQNPITPRFGLTYQYTDQDMVYASAAKGYRAGGSNSPTTTADAMCAPSAAALGLTSVPSEYDSDSLWSYEIGAKDSFLDQRLAIQTSVYYIDWTNIQTSVYLPSCGLGFTTNRGKAVSQGFDFQFSAVPFDGLKLSGNVGYDDAYHPNAFYGAVTNGVAPLVIGAGDKLPGIPPWTASVHAEYSWSIGQHWDGARPYARVDYRWLGEYSKADPNIAAYDPALGPVPNQAYGILNLRLGVIHRGLDLSAFVNNATNSRPLLSYWHGNPGDPLFSATAIRPLTAGLTALYRF